MPLLRLQCGFLACKLDESEFPAAISLGVFQTSELPITLFPVSLINSCSRVWARFENNTPQTTPT